MQLGAPAKASFPGTNGTIAFVRAGEVFTVDAAGTNLTQITFTAGAVTAACPGGIIGNVGVSADGKFITFATAAAGLFTIPSTGGSAVSVTGSIAGDLCPRYEPDGNRLVFANGAAGGGIFRINSPTGSLGAGGRTLIFGSLPGDASPDVKPDGTEVSFSRGLGGGNLGTIFSLPIGGGAAIQRTSGCPTAGGFPGCFQPDYSPDGSKIALDFGAGACGTATYKIAVIASSSTGAAPTAFTTSIGDDVQPYFSPDGTKIVLENCGAAATAGIHTIPSSGLPGRTTTTTGVLDAGPGWLNSGPPPSSGAFSVTGPSGRQTPRTGCNFTVTLSPAQSTSKSVDVKASSPDGAKFSALSQTLAFAAGDTSKTVMVGVTGKKKHKTTVVLTESNPTGGAALGTSSATCSIKKKQ